jgi:hypothetical protein
MIFHIRLLQMLALPGVLAAGLHEWIALWRSRRRDARRRPAGRLLVSNHRSSR